MGWADTDQKKVLANGTFVVKGRSVGEVVTDSCVARNLEHKKPDEEK